MRAPNSSLTRAMIVGPIEYEEAQAWSDGRPTDRQRVSDEGIPVWTVHGLAPEIILNGEAHLGIGEKVFLATATPMRVDGEPGSWISVQGEWRATKISFGEMTGRADLQRIGGEE
jgi:hypothetical protein